MVQQVKNMAIATAVVQATTTPQVQPLAGELPHAMGTPPPPASKKKKKERKEKTIIRNTCSLQLDLFFCYV